MIVFISIFLLSFFGTYYALPHSIRKLREKGYVSRDMYKNEKPNIPTNAGIIILFTSYIAIATSPLFVRVINFFDALGPGDTFYNFSEINLALLLVVSMYSIYGLIDDLIDVGRISKLLFPVIFAMPLISVINPESVWIPLYGYFFLESNIIFGISYSDMFRILLVPIYVMIVSNLVNMHSGYNGLQSGLSIIILGTLVFKAWVDGILLYFVPVSAFLGGMVSFWFFNKYPSKVFEGNIGSMMFGSLIGCVIVLSEYWWFGFFILIPHTTNLFLWFIWLYLMNKNPSNYLEKDGHFKKFGRINKSGFIEVPNRLTLKWIPNYYFELDEIQSTYIMYFITFLFCLLGILIF